MKKLFLAILIFCSISLQAETGLSLGSYISLMDMGDETTTYEPSYLLLNGYGDYKLFDNHLFLNGQAEMIYGFPTSDSNNSYQPNNLLWSSYGLGMIKIKAMYNHEYFTAGIASNIQLMPKDFSLNREIENDYKAYRTAYFIQEFFLRLKPLKGIEASANFGVGIENYAYAPETDQTSKPKDLGNLDNFIYVKSDIAYMPIDYIGPFVSVRYTDDLISSAKHNYSDIRTGARGNARLLNNDLHLYYEGYYKFVSSGTYLDGEANNNIIAENNHFGLYAKGRYNLPIGMDLFAWLNAEFSIDREKKVRYVERSLTLMIRQWIFDSGFYVAGGTSVFIEKGGEGYSTKDLYFPVWPFAEAGYSGKNLNIYMRYHHKFDMSVKDLNFGTKTYIPVQQKILFSAQYAIKDYFKPFFSFYFNDVLNFIKSDVDSLGMSLGIASVF